MGTLYSNFVLENKLESILTTKLNLMNYLTPDYSLQQSAGMTKKIHTYTPIGAVEDLAQGNGNTQSVDAGFVEREYTVGTTQGRFPWYDEQAMTDPAYVDAGIKGLAEIMANDLTTKAIKEFGHATLCKTTSNYALADIIDAIALYDYEDDSDLFMLIGQKVKAAIRKQLKDELKYVEDFARKGYIGHIMGLPVIASKAVPDDCAFIASKEAVTAFIKKGVESEQERDSDRSKPSAAYKSQPDAAGGRGKDPAASGRKPRLGSKKTEGRAGRERTHRYSLREDGQQYFEQVWLHPSGRIREAQAVHPLRERKMQRAMAGGFQRRLSDEQRKQVFSSGHH